MNKEFKVGYWWISYPSENNKIENYVSYLEDASEVLEDETLEAYLGADYNEFLRIYKTK